MKLSPIPANCRRRAYNHRAAAANGQIRPAALVPRCARSSCPAMQHRPETIAVVGAGLAGLTAARHLADAGRGVAVFDKSRGTGGRLATRRGPAGAFDHGAPAVDAREAAFAALLADLAARGAAERADGGWAGRPGMSGLVKPLAEGLTVCTATEIAEIARSDTGWRLTDTDGSVHGPFRAVALAIPAPQARARLPQAVAAPLDTVEMAPRWTLMLGQAPSKALGQGPSKGLAPARDPIETLIPQRGAPGRIVAHATAEWSTAHLEAPREAVQAALLATLGHDAPPVHVAVHRWRYARTARPLGRPFLDCGDGLVAGGDWALGDRAEHAWLSGRAMAAHLLATFP
ncbi:FAD-binding protein [Rhodobacteraceae bacterium CCMM004]|nr:FAD-binding protein [Rhodobacteraceae bacterium CCMM004]